MAAKEALSSRLSRHSALFDGRSWILDVISREMGRFWLCSEWTSRKPDCLFSAGSFQRPRPGLRPSDEPKPGSSIVSRVVVARRSRAQRSMQQAADQGALQLLGVCVCARASRPRCDADALADEAEWISGLGARIIVCCGHARDES